LIQPHVRSRRLQVSDEPQGELKVFTAITEKRRLCGLRHHSSLMSGPLRNGDPAHTGTMKPVRMPEIVRHIL